MVLHVPYSLKLRHIYLLKALLYTDVLSDTDGDFVYGGGVVCVDMGVR